MLRSGSEACVADDRSVSFTVLVGSGSDGTGARIRQMTLCSGGFAADRWGFVPMRSSSEAVARTKDVQRFARQGYGRLCGACLRAQVARGAVAHERSFQLESLILAQNERWRQA